MQATIFKVFKVFFIHKQHNYFSEGTAHSQHITVRQRSQLQPLLISFREGQSWPIICDCFTDTFHKVVV
jgi:hypothetical protein